MYTLRRGDLPRASSQPMTNSLPDITRCLTLMDQFSMLENIRRHSFMVARVADALLSALLKSAGTADLPSRDLVIAGALLHDIAKTECLRQNCSHAEVGAQICHELGYPDVAYIVGNHVVLSETDETRHSNGAFTAAELVFYADKRVMHDEVVSLEQRLVYILKRYGNNDPLRETYIRENFSQCQSLEKRLFARLDYYPSGLADQLVAVPADLNHYPPESSATPSAHP